MKDSTWVLIAIAFGFLVVSGGALAVSSLTGGPSQDIVQQIAVAIATAEGFFVSGSRPNRDNNPGDIKKDLIGKAISFDGDFPVYATPDDGWENLYTQVRLMFNGSQYYNPDMTIAQIGSLYASGDVHWSSNVANSLGVTPTTTLNQIAGVA